METDAFHECGPILTLLFFGMLVIFVQPASGKLVHGNDITPLYTKSRSRHLLVEGRYLANDGIFLLFQTVAEFDLLLADGLLT